MDGIGRRGSLLPYGASDANEKYEADHLQHRAGAQIDVVRQKHLDADEAEDATDTVLEEVKHIHELPQHEEHVAQSKHGKHRGTVSTKLILYLRDLGGDTVHRENEVHHLQQADDKKEHRGGAPGVAADNEEAAMDVVALNQPRAEHPLESSNSHAAFVICILIVLPGSIDSDVDQRGAKHVASRADAPERGAQERKEEHARGPRRGCRRARRAQAARAASCTS